MACAVKAWRKPLGGVVEQGMVILRSFRNLGGLQSSFAKSAARAPLYKWPRRVRLCHCTLSETGTCARVHPPQGGWMGWEKSESSHSTGEVGERIPSGAHGGKGKIGSRRLRRERWLEH